MTPLIVDYFTQKEDCQNNHDKLEAPKYTFVLRDLVSKKDLPLGYDFYLGSWTRGDDDQKMHGRGICLKEGALI